MSDDNLPVITDDHRKALSSITPAQRWDEGFRNGRMLAILKRKPSDVVDGCDDFFHGLVTGWRVHNSASDNPIDDPFDDEEWGSAAFEVTRIGSDKRAVDGGLGLVEWCLERAAKKLSVREYEPARGYLDLAQAAANVVETVRRGKP